MFPRFSTLTGTIVVFNFRFADQDVQVLNKSSNPGTLKGMAWAQVLFIVYDFKVMRALHTGLHQWLSQAVNMSMI